MILSMSGQAWLFLSTVAAGVVIGFAYDFFRIARKVIPHRYIVVQIEDVLYWAATSLMMFYFMFHSNYGEIRFFSIAGAAIGMVIYFNSLSIVVRKATIAVLRFLKKVLLTVARIVLAPVRLFYKLFAPPIRWLFSVVKSQMKSKASYINRAGTAKLRGLRRNFSVMLKKV